MQRCGSCNVPAGETRPYVTGISTSSLHRRVDRAGRFLRSAQLSHRKCLPITCKPRTYDPTRSQPIVANRMIAVGCSIVTSFPAPGGHARVMTFAALANGVPPVPRSMMPIDNDRADHPTRLTGSDESVSVEATFKRTQAKRRAEVDVGNGRGAQCPSIRECARRARRRSPDLAASWDRKSPRTTCPPFV